MPTTIYTLNDPQTDEVRYVGKTVRDNLSTRLSGHLWDAKHRRNHRNNWIQSLGQPPFIEPIAVVPDEVGSGVERYMIAAYRMLGFRLTNQANGGEGALGVVFSNERLARMSAAHKGKPYTPAQRRSIEQRKIKKTHCINGHLYTHNTLVFDRFGWRHCRICKNACARKSWHSRRQAKEQN